MAEVYVSTDIEADGPIPGPHSMLSFASAAFRPDKTLLGTFAANLTTLPGAVGDPRTMAWWRTQPEAWAACRADPRDPAVVMPQYVAWLKALPGRPVFVGYPAGNLGVGVRPYDIPFACLTPHEPGNLLVPTCLSASHVAYCSVRMEPVFMMLGHAAGDAAHLALAEGATVQTVDVPELRRLLRAEGAVLDAGYQPPVTIARAPEHPLPGQAVRFRVETGTLNDPVRHLWWDFEGTGHVAAEGREPEHSFPLEKLHTVSLVVEDHAGRATGLDVTLDATQARLFGRWVPYLPDVFIGPGAHRDVTRNGATVGARARFQPVLSRAGRYQVCLGFRPGKDQATRVPVVIRHAGGLARVRVDQRVPTTEFPFVPRGEFRFEEGGAGSVEVTERRHGGPRRARCGPLGLGRRIAPPESTAVG